jgi:hypothetical protein
MTGPRSWPPHGPDLDAAAEAQAEADWYHSPAWSAHEDEIDRLQMDEQHQKAIEENEARELEAGS